MNLRIFRSEVRHIAACMRRYPNLETGGALWGLWTRNGVPVILYATGPGPRSTHEVTSFFPDADYLEACGRELYQQFGLQHLGEWHSHHQLGLAQPSGGDVRTVWTGMQAHGWDRCLLGIGNLDRAVERVSRHPRPTRQRLSNRRRASHYTRNGRMNLGGCSGLSPRLAPIRTREVRQGRLGIWLFDRSTGTTHECGVEVIERTSPVRRARPQLPPAPDDRNTRDIPLALRPPRTESAPLPTTPWWAQPPTRARLARELKGLQLLGQLGWHAHLRPQDDGVTVSVQGDGAQWTWTLTPEFPHSAPLADAGSPVFRTWNTQQLMAEQLLPLLTETHATESAEEDVQHGPIADSSTNPTPALSDSSPPGVLCTEPTPQEPECP